MACVASSASFRGAAIQIRVLSLVPAGKAKVAPTSEELAKSVSLAGGRPSLFARWALSSVTYSASLGAGWSACLARWSIREGHDNSVRGRPAAPTKKQENWNRQP